MSKRYVAATAVAGFWVVSSVYLNGSEALAVPSRPVSPVRPGVGPCPSEPRPTHESVIPKTLEVPIPYPAVTAVPYPAAVPRPTRIEQPALPVNTCVDPCPDLTDHATPPAGSLFGLPIPQLKVAPHPFFFGFPLPGPKPDRPAPPPMAPGVEPAVRTPAPPMPRIGAAREVAKETGAHSINRTDKRWQVQGTDLGIMWESAPGEIAVAFGDTVGRDFHPPGGMGEDWRSNVLAFSSNRDLEHGMLIDRMVLDSRCHAAEVLPSRKLDNIEITTIPTSGFALGNRQYLSYMSIRTWNTVPGMMYTNHGGIAYSDDHGRTWTKDPYAKWDNIFGLANFQVSAMVPQGDYVYMFGTPNSRMGAVGLARVPKDRVLNKTAYQYWHDGSWAPVDAASATPIVSAPAGELSVRYNPARRKWQMSYLDSLKFAITLRESASPQGLWSESAPLLRVSERYPELYGGFMHPWSKGNDLYFTVSTWSDYNVYLMHAKVN